MTGEIVLGLCNAVLAFASLAMWRTLRYQGGRINELEADKRLIEADKSEVEHRLSRERSASGTFSTQLKAAISAERICLGTCDHVEDCPVVELRQPAS